MHLKSSPQNVPEQGTVHTEPSSAEPAASPGDYSRVGRRIGAELVLEEHIAKRPLGSVYRGRWGERAVAVKVYRSDLPMDDSELRVQREQQAHARVRHPCVAELLDCGRLADGASYLVSPWIEGTRLEEKLAAGPTPWDRLEPVVRAAARGLHAIHAAGVIHRDVKPSNIVLPASGDPPAVLLDFGHALVIDDERLTDQGWTLGSAAYMAPEQAAGEPLDARSDLYSLGVVIYRALTGALPFEGDSPAEVMSRHLREPVVPPCERAPASSIPAAAQDLCMWLLAKDRSQRLPNANVLALTLQGMGRVADTTASR